MQHRAWEGVDPALRKMVEGQLYPFQREAVERLGPRALLCHDPGLGKTRTALAALVAYRAFPALVVAPLSVLGFWEEEAERVLRGTGIEIKVIRGKEEISGEKILALTNPEQLKRIIGKDWKGLILDESHLYKNAALKFTTRDGTRTVEYRTQRVELARRIARRCRMVWLLTATPDPNYNPEELVPQLDILGALWTVFGGRSAFLQQYGRMEKVRIRGQVRWEVTGWRSGAGRAEAFKTLESKGLLDRRTKAEVAPWLPPIVQSILPVRMQPGEWDRYRRIRREVLEEWEAQVKGLDPERQKEELRRRMNAWAAVSLLKMRKFLEEQKVAWAENMKEAVEGPAVWFVHFTEVAKALGDVLAAPVIIGDTPDRERARAVQAFVGGQIRHIVLGIRAGGVGLSFPNAQIAVFLGADWSPGVMAQAISRIHRINREVPEPPTVWHVVMTGPNGQRTVDHHIRMVAGRKEWEAAAPGILLELLMQEEHADSGSG
ncbi:MAG: DEAD/DEAH box helicase [Anaerolineae bacterium]|nr:DEAD/DEAH box helicase [Anaerolineae bacterium]